jgi:hypothetical protein
MAAFMAGRATRPEERSSRVEVRATPGVVLAIRDTARLESTVFHIEKVVEASDPQSHLWGLVQTKDALLLVAVGDVVAGVDLAKVRDSDVQADPAMGTVRAVLPQPEIVSSSFDEQATHVYSRTTGLLAARNEQLEGEARRKAETQMRAEAIDEGIFDRARASTARTLSALLHQLGYGHVTIDWTDRS